MKTVDRIVSAVALIVALALAAVAAPAFAGSLTVLGGQTNDSHNNNLNSSAMEVQADLTSASVYKARVGLSLAYLNEGAQQGVKRQGVAVLASVPIFAGRAVGVSLQAGPYARNASGAADSSTDTSTSTTVSPCPLSAWASSCTPSSTTSTSSVTSPNDTDGWKGAALAGVDVDVRLTRSLSAVGAYQHVFGFNTHDADLYLVGLRVRFP